MKALVVAFRLLAVLAGVFLVGGSAADVAGLVPHSEAMPSVAQRLVSNALPCFFGLVLLAPQRWFIARSRFLALLLAHLVVIVFAAYRALETFVWADAGRLDPVAVPIMIGAAAIPVLSATALWLLRQRSTPPNNSSKPTPLRGAA